MGVVVCLVSLAASVVGAICGVGGGILIKPVLDAVAGLDVATVNFLSGCTVLSMTAFSVGRMLWRQRSSGGAFGRGLGLDVSRDTPLALGAAAGGLAGRQLFSLVQRLFANPDAAGAAQAALLVAVTAGTLVYTLFKDRVETREVCGAAPCAAIGLALGTCSSFLGIGGGPINLVVLFYFFSMDTKGAATASLYVILFSQAASVAAALLTQDLAGVDGWLLAAMMACGVAGGAFGRSVSASMDDRTVDRLFVALMAVIIVINVCNMAKFAALA